MASPLAQLASPPDDDEEEGQAGNTDTVPAMLTPHEAILNVGAKKILGKAKIDKLNARGRKARGKGKGYAAGTSDVEDDNPPGAPQYERGPFANPKPTPAPRVKGYQRGTSDVSSDEEGNQYDKATGALVAGASQVRAAAGDSSASSFGSGWTPTQNASLDSLRTPPSPPDQPNLTPAGLKLAPVRAAGRAEGALAGVIAPVAPAAGALAGGYGNNKQVGSVPGAPVTASRNPNPGAENVLSGIPPTAPGSNVTVTGAQPASFGATDLTAPAQPTGAEVAGARVRSAIGSAAGAVKNFFSRGPQTSPPPAAGIGGERVDIPAGGENALAPIAGFARGLTGRSIASGVSNAQAARIQQPTAANPVPVTDTTPDMHPDESENAITRFGRLPTGLFDNPNTRRKLGYKKTAFAGF